MMIASLSGKYFFLSKSCNKSQKQNDSFLIQFVSFDPTLFSFFVIEATYIHLKNNNLLEGSQ